MNKTVVNGSSLLTHVSGRPPGLLVHNPAGGRYHPHRLSGAFSARAARYGAHGLTLHGLRHHWCDQMRRNGVDLRIIQQLAGHASLNTTMLYLCPDESELAAAIGQLRPAA